MRDGNTIIESIGAYLPAREVTTEAVVAGCRTPLTLPLERLTGIHSRRVAARDEGSFELARHAARNCLAQSSYAPGEIDLVIAANCSKMDARGQFCVEPSSALRLCGELGLSSAICFDLSNACAGMWTAIYVVDALLRTGEIRSALVVSGEFITHMTRTAQLEIEGNMDPRLACLTLGDSGVAVLLETSSDRRVGLQELDLLTISKYHTHCVAGPTERAHGGAIMHTDMIRLTEAGIRHSIAHALRVLRRSGRALADFQHIVPHQSSRFSIKGAIDEFNRVMGADACPPAMMLDNLRERGNTASTSVLLAAWDGMRSGRIRNGDRVVMAITGSGLTVGTGVYTFDELPQRVRDGTAAPSTPRPARRRTARSKTIAIERIALVRRGSSPANTSTELVEQAVRTCLSSAERSVSDVELLIHVGLYRSGFLVEPTTAASTAGRLGMNAEGPSAARAGSFVFDLANGATGYLNACHAAEAVVQTGRARVVVITASEVDLNAGSTSRGILEMGSSTLLRVDEEGRAGFLAFEFRAFPEHADRFRAVGVHTASVPSVRIECSGECEALYLEILPGAVAEFLKRHAPERVDLLIAPRPFAGCGRLLAERLQMDGVRVVEPDVEGDPFTSSIPLQLELARERGWCREGDVALLVSVDPGIQCGCALYRF